MRTILTLIVLLNASAFAESWHTASVPASWKKAPQSPQGGGQPDDLLFRCWVDIPADWKDARLELFIESVDDAREVFIQRTPIGKLGELPPDFRSGLGETRRLAIPGEAIEPGRPNEILIRVHRSAPRENFNVAAPVLFAGEKAISLNGDWQWRPGDSPGEVAPEKDIPEGFTFSKQIAADEINDRLKALAQGDRPLSPSESLATMKTPDDLAVDLVLSDPVIGQPLSMKFDARGRLWLVEYLQYPNPAGLKAISRDKYLRTVYDKIPPAPPNHDRGRDRVTIHEDTTGDGKYDRHQTFIDGLNMVSSVAIDHDGVWVLNPPYLLFYPDKNHDDQPDGDPEVHLQGFGLEDSHSVVNSIRFGPDGWLYAAQGSTVTGRVKRPSSDDQPVNSMGQLIWRYHPQKRQYEIFAEGGGNTFGVEIDSKGRIFSGHNGGDTRGFHYVQGGYSRKGFGKHGELSNPFAFGYFPAMKHKQVPRFTHTFEIYEEAALPTAYHGKLFAVAPLQGHVVLSKMESDGSTFQTTDIGYALESTDTWFRPVDVQSGPDGGVYVADFYEQRIDHASHYQGRVHKESGRIYRLRAKQGGDKSAKPASQSTAELLESLANPNRWVRETAVRLLAHSEDGSLNENLAERLAGNNKDSLEALWTLHQRGALNPELAATAVGHSNPYVRAWAIRLICDDREVSAEQLRALVELAKSEPHAEVNSQLAASARRLSAPQSAALIRELLRREELAEDPHIPLLVWWACEALIRQAPDELVDLLLEDSIWNEPLVGEVVLSRTMRRFASGGQSDLGRCARLLAAAETEAKQRLLMQGLEEAFSLRGVVVLPNALEKEIARAGGGSLTMRIRNGEVAALKEAAEKITSDQTNAKERIELISAPGQRNADIIKESLLEVALRTKDEAIRSAALAALQNYNDLAIAKAVADAANDWTDASRESALSLLASRPAWAGVLLDLIEAKKVNAEQVSPLMVERMRMFENESLDQRISTIWPENASIATSGLNKKVQGWKEIIASAAGNPYRGKVAYKNLCGKCHQLFEEGDNIGPNLTSYQRGDLDRILINIAAPSLEIREGYETWLVLTEDGRTLSGFIADQSPQVVVIRGADGSVNAIDRNEIEVMRVTKKSLMPEDMFASMSDEQIRDLIAYLRSTQPLP